MKHAQKRLGYERAFGSPVVAIVVEYMRSVDGRSGCEVKLYRLLNDGRYALSEWEPWGMAKWTRGMREEANDLILPDLPEACR